VKSLIDKKRGLIFVVLSLFLTQINSVFAQSFNFGRGSSGTGVYNAISNALDIIFGGIVRPIFDSISFNNFEAAVKIALWVILFIIFSHLIKGYLKKSKMSDKSAAKFSKVIGAIVALLSVAFVPERILEVVFRDFLGGLIGFLLVALVTIYPLYLLYDFSKGGDKAQNLVAAAGFLLMLIFLPYVHDELIFAFSFGVMQTLSSLMITFGIVAAVILMIHRLVQGFKGEGGDEEEDRGEEPRQQRELRDELEGVKALANQTIEMTEQARSHMDSTISGSLTTFMNDVFTAPDMLNFVSRATFHPIYANVDRIEKHLLASKKNKGKCKQIAKELNKEYQEMYETLRLFSSNKGHLVDHLRHNRRDNPFFSRIHNIIKQLAKDLDTLSRTLHKINSL